MGTSRFNGKTILITGAGTGMGKATALRLVAEGAQLALMGRREQPLFELASQISELGGKALVLPCDIANVQEMTLGIQKIMKHFGRLDGLFANAGILGDFKPLTEVTLNEMDELVEVNLKGTFISVQQSVLAMSGGSKGSGSQLGADKSIVINASWTANGVMPGSSAYAGTKGALQAMTRVLAVEQGKQGIRINAINPGIILTPMADEVLSPELSAKLAAHTALGRNGVPEDVTGTVAWLLSEDAAFVTGQEINIDGGYTIGGVRL